MHDPSSHLVPLRMAMQIRHPRRCFSLDNVLLVNSPQLSDGPNPPENRGPQAFDDPLPVQYVAFPDGQYIRITDIRV